MLVDVCRQAVFIWVLVSRLKHQPLPLFFFCAAIVSAKHIKGELKPADAPKFMQNK